MMNKTGEISKRYMLWRVRVLTRRDASNPYMARGDTRPPTALSRSAYPWILDIPCWSLDIPTGQRPTFGADNTFKPCKGVIGLFFAACALAVGILLSGCERENADPREVMVLTDTTFDKVTAKGIVLVEFWGAWCVPCVEQRGIVIEVAAEAGGKGVRVAHLDLGFEEVREKVEHLNIEYVPTLVIFKKGKPFKTFEGLTQKEPLLEAINAAKAAR